MSEFDDKAATWDENPERIKRAEIIAKRIASNVDLSKIDSVLEYGSGTGLLSFALKNKLKSATLMDESAEMIKVALAKSKALNIKNLHPIQYDLLTQPLPEDKYDLIFLLLTLHHIQDVHTLLSRFSNLLNDNGNLIIIDLEKEDGSFHDGEFHGHNGFLKAELEKQLINVGLIAYHYEIPLKLEKEHDGSMREYPVFMMISRKED